MVTENSVTYINLLVEDHVSIHMRTAFPNNPTF